MKFYRITLLLAATLASGAITYAQRPDRDGSAPDPAPAVVDAEVLRRAGTPDDALPGSWLTYGLSQSETRYSPLRQIDASNVGRLGLEWTYTIGAGGGNQEGTPLVWNGTIYGITTWSVVFAVDAVTGEEIWRWDPEVNQAAVRPKICCGVVNRGIALYNGMIIAPVIDGRLHALDARTGRPVWETRMVYPQDGYTLTMAPRIAGDKVIIGAAGGDRYTRGLFDAYDASGARRTWTTSIRVRSWPSISTRASCPRRLLNRRMATHLDPSRHRRRGGERSRTPRILCKAIAP